MILISILLWLLHLKFVNGNRTWMKIVTWIKNMPEKVYFDQRREKKSRNREQKKSKVMY